MKKEYKRLFAFLILGIFVISFIGLVAGATDTEYFLRDNLIEPIKGFINDYIIPSNVFESWGANTSNFWIVVSLLGMIIFYAIIYEVISTFSPLSRFINILIVIFVSAILTLLGFVRSIVGWLMIGITAVAGGIGVFGMIMTMAIFILGAVAFFFGTQWIHQWIAKIKYNRALQSKLGNAEKKASDVNALTRMAGDIGGFK